MLLCIQRRMESCPSAEDMDAQAQNTYYTGAELMSGTSCSVA